MMSVNRGKMKKFLKTEEMIIDVKNSNKEYKSQKDEKFLKI